MIPSVYVLVPFDVTRRNRERVVIKIALLDYSDSESRQWGSLALSAAEVCGAGGGVEGVLLLGYGTWI